jgi:hypothetical protein
MQNHHSVIYREEEREMFPTLKVCVYSDGYIYVSYSCVESSTSALASSHGALWRVGWYAVL